MSQGCKVNTVDGYGIHPDPGGFLYQSILQRDKNGSVFLTDFQNLTGHLRKKRHPGGVALRPWEDKWFQNKELPCRW